MKKLASVFVILVFVGTKACSQDTGNTKSAASNWDSMFSKIEIEASYPGGNTAWMNFLNKNLHYPDDAINKGVQGVVIVQFIVHADSTISDVQAISGPKKGGLRDESMRVVIASGKWVPTTQNGKAVLSYHKVPITFKLSY